MKKLRIIVGGYIGLLPAGGVTWDYLQYPLGLHLMGHDVYYIEDTRLYPVYQSGDQEWDNSNYCIEKLQEVMNDFGFSERWAYRDEVTGTSFGLSELQIKKICDTADLFINISCSTFLRDEYLKIPIRVLIDSDPMFTQIQYLTSQTFTPGKSSIKEQIDAHNYLFTFGENIGSPDCKIPDCGKKWIPTRQPICLSYWETSQIKAIENHPSFSTVMNWSAGKDLIFQDERWGQKNLEFGKIIDLPSKFKKSSFSIIVNEAFRNKKEEIECIVNKGWLVLEAEKFANHYSIYKQTIHDSAGEVSVAKHTYVKSASGWFSCRCACYLASGKPVVTQETGWSNFIPQGNGLFAFNDLEESINAMEQIFSDYVKHAKDAKAIANTYFDSSKVLNNLLSNIN